MKDVISLFFENVAYVANVFGLALLVVGFARGAVGWLQLEFKREKWETRLGSIRKLRCVVGTHILFSLEILIVADIVDGFTAVARNEDGLGDFFHGEVFYALVQLSMIVAIRTVIDYFLGKEMNEIHEPRAEHPT